MTDATCSASVNCDEPFHPFNLLRNLFLVSVQHCHTAPFSMISMREYDSNDARRAGLRREERLPQTFEKLSTRTATCSNQSSHINHANLPEVAPFSLSTSRRPINAVLRKIIDSPAFFGSNFGLGMSSCVVCHSLVTFYNILMSYLGLLLI